MLSGRWSIFNVDPMEAFRLPLVGGCGRGRGRLLGLVLGNDDGVCEAMRSITQDQLKSILANQLETEKRMGADDPMIETLKTIFADIEHLASGRYIVNGIRM
jgi:hypothetical protein